MLLACHGRATLRAAATGLGTALHRAVVAHASTGLGALAADLRARTAGGRVNCSASQPGVGAGSADVRTRRQQADVLGCSLLAALVEAVVAGLPAGRMALGAVVDALVHGLGALGCCLVGPVFILRYCDCVLKPPPPPPRPPHL